MKKLFTNNLFFSIVTWVAVIGALPLALVVFIYYDKAPLLQVANVMRLALAACLAVTYISYKKHAKNVMKGMMGAVLMSALVIVLIAAFSYTEYPAHSWLAVGLMALLFVNHFVINADHRSSPAYVLFNQILSIVIAVMTCVEGISLLSECVNTADTIAQIIACVAQPCGLLSIICIESRLDSFRQDREAAGWTEEKGYPEQYVHEFEKNK